MVVRHSYFILTHIFLILNRKKSKSYGNRSYVNISFFNSIKCSKRKTVILGCNHNNKNYCSNICRLHLARYYAPIIDLILLSSGIFPACCHGHDKSTGQYFRSDMINYQIFPLYLWLVLHRACSWSRSRWLSSKTTRGANNARSVDNMNISNTRLAYNRGFFYRQILVNSSLNLDTDKQVYRHCRVWFNY